MMISTMPEIKKIFKSTAALLFWIVLWQIAAAFANKDLLIALPTPISTLSALISGFKQPSFYISALLSIARISLGFLLALIIGTVCGVLSSRIQLFDALFSPLLKVIRAVPVASFIILVFLWMSRESVPTFISFLTVLPIIWTNVADGIKATDKQLLEMARVMGMKRNAVLRHIVLPGAMPFITSAVSTGLGFAWKSGVAAEVICRTKDSLGELLWVGKSSVNYDEVFAVTIVVVILSVAAEHGVSFLFKRRAKQ